MLSLALHLVLIAQDSSLALQELKNYETLKIILDHHFALSAKEWDYPYSPTRARSTRDHYQNQFDSLIEKLGGDSFLKDYRQSDLHRKTSPKLSYSRVLADRNISSLLGSDSIETIIQFDYPRDHLSVAPDGRIYFDHFDTGPSFPIKLEVLDPETGRVKAFPGREF